MGTIVAFENITLDGVTQDPTGEQGVSPAGWLAGLRPADRQAWEELILADAREADALLLGRRSYEFFAGRYPTRTGPLAEQMNGLPKYVVSRTLERADWSEATVLGGDAAAEVAALKDKIDGQLRIYASARLLPTLVAGGLVDELRLVVFPLVQGRGERLFGPTEAPRPLRLVESRPVGANLLHLTYRCANG